MLIGLNFVSLKKKQVLSLLKAYKLRIVSGAILKEINGFVFVWACIFAIRSTQLYAFD